MSSSVSSTSTSASTQAIDLNTLIRKRDENRRLLEKTVAQRIDFHHTVMGEKLAENIQANRGVLKGISPEFLASEGATEITGEKFTRRQFNSYANTMHRRFIEQWEKLQNPKVNATSLTAEMHTLCEDMINRMPYFLVGGTQLGDAAKGIRTKERSTVVVRRFPHSVPDDPFKVYMLDLRIKWPKNAEEAQAIPARAVQLNQNFLIESENVRCIGLFRDTPGDYYLKPLGFNLNQQERGTDPEYMFLPYMLVEAQPVAGNVSTAVLVSEQAAKVLTQVVKEEESQFKKAVGMLSMDGLYRSKIQAATPAPVAAHAISTDVATLLNAQKIGKAKKGARVPLALDDDNQVAAAPAVTAPQPEKPQVVMKDYDLYSTFRALIGKDNAAVSWKAAVRCMKALGFEVTQQETNGNTWKFSYKNQSWERNEKTYDEQFDPVEAGTSSRSFHEPHQGGLTKRGPLDEGRLSSFRKLLAECLFDETSVKFN